MNTTCKNCGGDKGLHHWQTHQCPFGGREAPIGQPDQWTASTFEPARDTLREALNQVMGDVEEAQQYISKPILRASTDERARRALEATSNKNAGMWICSCGKKNWLTVKYCENCEEPRKFGLSYAE